MTKYGDFDMHCVCVEPAECRRFLVQARQEGKNAGLICFLPFLVLAHTLPWLRILSLQEAYRYCEQPTLRGGTSFGSLDSTCYTCQQEFEPHSRCVVLQQWKVHDLAVDYEESNMGPKKKKKTRNKPARSKAVTFTRPRYVSTSVHL